MRTGRRWWILWWILAVLVLVVLAVAGWWLRDMLAQDACLDAGGAWRDGACRR